MGGGGLVSICVESWQRVSGLEDLLGEYFWYAHFERVGSTGGIGRCVSGLKDQHGKGFGIYVFSELGQEEGGMRKICEE